MSATERLDEIEARAAAARSRAHQGWPTSTDVHDQVDTVDDLVATLRAVLRLVERMVTLDVPHPGHDHLCPDDIAAAIHQAITAALDGTE